ncbi:hypothetical protein HS7_00940 [Sulfolobales archaeon HS-7]|nr:hypothetical protein HS7_00940 [Sulfolobales archaeon HS-7]
MSSEEDSEGEDKREEEEDEDEGFSSSMSINDIEYFVERTQLLEDIVSGRKTIEQASKDTVHKEVKTRKRNTRRGKKKEEDE